MNSLRSVVVCGLLASFGLMAQSPAPTSGSANQAETALPANQELNIEAYIELLRSDIRKSKSMVVGQVMQLDSDQATTFWPIYKQFEADLSKIGDRISALVRNYAKSYDDMTNNTADRLANDLLSIEQERNDLKKQYYQKFKKALDPITAARFLQVENQLERLVDLQIASELPVIQATGEKQ